MKRIIISALIMVVFLNMANSVFAEESNHNFAEEAVSAVLLEKDTGAVLYEKNSHEQLPPASMTKIMTMLLIMEAIDEGNLEWDDMVRTSERAASMGGSQIFLEAGEEMSVRDMMKGIAIASGNDASVAMAEHLAGSETEFVRLMNEKTAELGLENTRFENSNGLPAENHYSSAYDLALMAKELLKYEEITEYTGLYEDYLRKNTDDPFWLVNTNKLVRFYPGVDGLKTGYTREAKYGLTASAEKDGMRMIAVVMGAPKPAVRNSYVSEMFDYAYSQYELHPLYEAGEVISQVKVDKGSSRKVNVVPEYDVSLLLKKGEAADGVSEKMTMKEKVFAPLDKGEILGDLVLVKDGKNVSSVPLVAEKQIDQASFLELLKRNTGTLFGNSSR